MPSQGPLIPRRRLGLELRRLRESAGLNLDASARHLECSPSKISRLENGLSVPKARDVRDLLDLYGVEDQRSRDQLVRLAGEGRRQAWWQPLSDVVSTNMDTFISLESEASNIRSFVQLTFPGILQIEDYARALFRHLYPDVDDTEIEKLVQLRLGRKKIMQEREEKPRISVILDEATVRRVVGSPEIMAKQLLALLEFNAQPDITLRVYPFSAGPRLGAQCTFVVFTFESEYDRNSVHIELSAGDRWLEHEQDVQQYTRLFDDLGRGCLDRAATDELLRELVTLYSEDQPQS